jgi:hypothetical protein
MLVQKLSEPAPVHRSHHFIVARSRTITGRLSADVSKIAWCLKDKEELLDIPIHDTSCIPPEHITQITQIISRLHQLYTAITNLQRSPASKSRTLDTPHTTLHAHAASMPTASSHRTAASLPPNLQPHSPPCPLQLVVLSPDAPEPLEEVFSDKVYCIGGIVDRAIIKGVTHSFASSHSLQCRRLPIREHAFELGMQPRTNMNPVLNVNDVAAALLEYRSSGSWVQALQVAVPQRKRVAKITKKPKKQRARSLQHLFEPPGPGAGGGDQQSTEVVGAGVAVSAEVVPRV